jgi:hypothetical protein
MNESENLNDETEVEPNVEVELDDDILVQAAGGFSKQTLPSSDINAGGDQIYSIPAIELVSNFSDHHIDNINSGITLIN